MANVKNFGLIGVGSDLQLGKAGTRIVNNAGTFNFKAANGSTDAALTAAGITSASGNVTLTTGNLVLTDTAGTLGIGGTTLSRATEGVLKADGTGAFMVPVGSTAQQPVGQAGMVRVNSTNTNSMEYHNGTTWITLASGGNTQVLQDEIDAIQVALGAAYNTTTDLFDGTQFTGGAFSSPTSFTSAIQQVANYATSKDTLDEIFPSTANGNVIYSNNLGEWAQAAPGSTSGVQAYDAGLEALATKTSTGILVQTGADTYASRTLQQPTRGITISDADGILGNPTFALANTLAALENLGQNATPGYIAITGDGTAAVRTFAVVSGDLAITGDANGQSTNTTFGLATVTQANTGDFVKVTLDTKGRVTGNTAVTTADVTALVNSEYLRLDGTNSMSANLNAGGFRVTNLADPTDGTDAATKNYVDNAVSGLSWKQAVAAASTGNLTLSGAQTVDGVALVSGDRVLVKNQTDATQNGIYVVAAGAWTRGTNSDTSAELTGAAVFVTGGTTQANSGWTQTTVLPIIGTDPIVWTQFSGAGAYTGGVGIDVTGNVISAKLGAGITDLPTGEIGADVATGKALQLTSTATGGQLTFVLDTGSGLEQSATGLKISAAGVTNAMLQNSAISLDADTGTGSVALGATLEITGNATQGIDTSVATGTFNVTARDATDLQKGVASFSATQFTVTGGNVTLDTVAIADGGTGKTSFVNNQLHYGQFEQSSALSFDGTDTLTLANSTFEAGADLVITSTATNGDIVLNPNGSGSVIVGPVGAGLIQSDTGTALTVRGNNGLTLETGTSGQDIVMLVPTGTGTKVTVGGATAADYATGLADADLVNKKYVDDAIQSGAAAGAIKAVSALVDLGASGSTNVGALLPAGATILSVKVRVGVVDTGTGTLSVGISGDTAKYMTSAENDTQSSGIYISETYATETGAVQVIATVAGSPASGSANVIVEYQVAE